jgi:hypothetical protein
VIIDLLYLPFQRVGQKYILLGAKLNLSTQSCYILRNNFQKITSGQNKYKQGLHLHLNVTQQKARSQFYKL